MQPREAQSTVLRDGRALCFRELGDRAGRPALYFHGFPGSRLEAGLVEASAKRAGVRLIAVDRPGFGGSDHQPERRILDWPADVAELADRLGLARFAVIGASGGAPYAAACARAFPERLEAVVIACGLAPPGDPALARGMLPWNRLALCTARGAPWLTGAALALLAPLARRSSRALVRRLAARLPDPDRRLLARPAVQAILAASIRESFRAGGRGPARELALLARPWGFELSEVRARVLLWHGARDVIVPQAMGRRIAHELPACDATWPAEEGHFSLVVERADEILAALR